MGSGSSKNLVSAAKEPTGTSVQFVTVDRDSNRAKAGEGSFKTSKGAWGFSGSTRSVNSNDDPLKKAVAADLEMEDLDLDDQFRVNWKELADKIPSELTPREMERRKELFEAWDANENGYLSLAELNNGIRKTSGLENLNKCKPAMMRAYSAAKYVKKGKAGGRFDEFVGHHEFRVLCVYLNLYFHLNEIFSSENGGPARYITLEEFGSASNSLRQWGAQMDGDPATTFRKVNPDASGSVLYEQFAEWMIDHNAKYLSCKDDESE